MKLQHFFGGCYALAHAPVFEAKSKLKASSNPALRRARLHKPYPQKTQKTQQKQNPKPQPPKSQKGKQKAKP